MHVASSVAKNVFRAHSGMAWEKIEKEVLKNLNGVVLPVQLAYQVSGDVGKMSYLKLQSPPVCPKWSNPPIHMKSAIVTSLGLVATQSMPCLSP